MSRPVPRPPEGNRQPALMRLTEPQGAITDAHPPVPITVRITWQNAGESTFIDHAYALAWTRSEALAYWRDNESGRPLFVWLPVSEVRRRT